MGESKKPQPSAHEEGAAQPPIERDLRAFCCDLMVLAGGGCFAVGGFLLHVVAGCFVLGAVMVSLAILLQRQGVDRDAV